MISIDGMIIGVEKAATTSLFRYLSSHSSVASHDVMELPYFVNEDVYKQGFDKCYNSFYTSNQNADFILAKNVGCVYFEEAHKRLYEHNPNMRLVVLLREPVSRAFSAHQYALQKGREIEQSFDLAVKKEPERLSSGKMIHKRYNAYLDRGLYFKQLEKLLNYFNKNQIKIVLFEEFKENPNDTLEEILTFFDLKKEPIDTNEQFNRTVGGAKSNHLFFKLNKIIGPMLKPFFNRKSRDRIKKIFFVYNKKDNLDRPCLSEATKKELTEYFRSDIELLESNFKIDLSKWKSINQYI
ncbi:MAG: sulfotransferase domain-containing protein [Kangiellaceae bacterium]|nr:sulfotransferase domain-containing protein [Kangiellaceae bacterium]